MGVSSERVPTDPSSIEGTGSRGTAIENAHGTWPTFLEGGDPEDDEPETDDRPHTQEPAEGPRSAWLDRTVGETRPDPIKHHHYERGKNPGH